MTLIVEDGTGLDMADSYVSLAEAQTYATSRGWTVANDELSEQQLRRAFDAINLGWFYKGEALTENQAGAFPRKDIGVPKNVKDAQLEMLKLISEGLDPFATQTGATTEKTSKVGPITKTVKTEAQSSPRLVSVEALLRQYVTGGTLSGKGSGNGTMRLVRT